MWETEKRPREKVLRDLDTASHVTHRIDFLSALCTQKLHTLHPVLGRPFLFACHGHCGSVTQDPFPTSSFLCTLTLSSPPAHTSATRERAVQGRPGTGVSSAHGSPVWDTA